MCDVSLETYSDNIISCCSLNMCRGNNALFLFERKPDSTAFTDETDASSQFPPWWLHPRGGGGRSYPVLTDRASIVPRNDVLSGPTSTRAREMGLWDRSSSIEMGLLSSLKLPGFKRF